MNNFKIIQNPNDHFGQLEWNDKLAIAASHELSIASTTIEEKRLRLKRKVFCFNHPNSIHEYSIKILAHPKFPLMKQLNEFIRRTGESGCISNWLKRYRLKAEKQPKLQYTTVTIQGFVSSAAVYVCLSFFALFVIAMEILVDRKVKAPDSAPVWRYIEMSIDPYRHFLLNDLDFSRGTNHSTKLLFIFRSKISCTINFFHKITNYSFKRKIFLKLTSRKFRG